MHPRTAAQVGVDVDAFRSSSPDLLYPPPIGGGKLLLESQFPTNLLKTLSGASRALKGMYAVFNVWSKRVNTA